MSETTDTDAPLDQPDTTPVPAAGSGPAPATQPAEPDSPAATSLHDKRYRGPRQHPRIVALLAAIGLIAALTVVWALLAQPRMLAAQESVWDLVRDDKLAEAMPLIHRYRRHRPFYNSIRLAFDLRADQRLDGAVATIAATNELAAIGVLRHDTYFSPQEARRVSLLHAATDAYDQRILATLDECIAKQNSAAGFDLLGTAMQTDAGRSALSQRGIRLYDLQTIKEAAAKGQLTSVLALIERNPIPAFQAFRSDAFTLIRSDYVDVTKEDSLKPFAGRRVLITGDLTSALKEEDGLLSVATFQPDHRKAPPLALRFAPGCATLEELQQAGVSRGARVTFYGVLDFQEQRVERLLWKDHTREVVALSPVEFWIPSAPEAP